MIHLTETQARDIFDLNLLLDQGAQATNIQFSKKVIEIAIKNALTINYPDFKGHVIAFLMEEYKTLYDSSQKWHDIRTQVIVAPEGMIACN